MLPWWGWTIIAAAVAIAVPALVVVAWLIVRHVDKGLPQPGTFAEGERQKYGWLGAGAGMFCGGMSIAMIALLMWGGWSRDEEHTIVMIFGFALGGFIAAMCFVIIGLLAGGPVGRFKGSVTRAGVTFETDDKQASLVPSVTTTTTVAPAAPVAPKQEYPVPPAGTAPPPE